MHKLSQFLTCVSPLQALTAEVKTTWVNEIRKVLTTQLEACRGTEKRICNKFNVLTNAVCRNWSNKCFIGTDFNIKCSRCVEVASSLCFRSQPAEGTRACFPVPSCAQWSCQFEVCAFVCVWVKGKTLSEVLKLLFQCVCTHSPFKSGQKSFKRGEEKKAEPCSPDVNSSSSPKPTGKGAHLD